MIIKPCPFCGGAGYVEEASEKIAPFARVFYTRVRCETCGCSTRKFYRRESVPQEIIEDDVHEIYVVETWNRRQGDNTP